jgi:cytochrome c551/c552
MKNWIELTAFRSSQEQPFRDSSVAKSHVLSHALGKEIIVANCRAIEQCYVGPGYKVVAVNYAYRAQCPFAL